MGWQWIQNIPIEQIAAGIAILTAIFGALTFVIRAAMSPIPRAGLHVQAQEQIPATTDAHAAIDAYLTRLNLKVLARLNRRKIEDIERDYIRRRIKVIKGNPANDEVIDDAELILFAKQHLGAILFGAAGAGKSTTVDFLILRLLREFSALGTPNSIPILIEASAFVCDLDKALRKGDVKPTEDHVATYVVDFLWKHVFEPFDVPTPRPSSRSRELQERLRQLDYKPALLIEAFDEIPQLESRKFDLREVFVQALRQVTNELRRLGIPVTVSSRFGYEGVLQPLLFRDTKLEELLDCEEVGKYLKSRWHSTRLIQQNSDAIARVFVHRLNSRILYLRLLSEYLIRTGSLSPLDGVSDYGLLKSYVDEQIKENQLDLKGDAHGQIQRRCLYHAASHLTGSATISEGDLLRIVQKKMRRRQGTDQFIRVIKRFFVEVEDAGGLKFPHSELRDYFLCCKICSDLGDDSSLSLVEISTVLAFPRVMVLSVQAIKDVPDDVERSRLRDRLAAICGERETRTFDRANRNRPSRSAAALSLYARCFRANQLGQKLRGCCLVGLDGANQDFSGLDLSDAVLRDSDLRGANLWRAVLVGADLDNARLLGADLRGADLHGAILKNAELGKLNCRDNEHFARNGDPTDFSGARLKDTDWFNFRIVLHGFTQFWDARLLEDECHLLLSNNRGTLWQLDLSDSRNAPQELSLGHTADLVAFDLHPDGTWLATASRDATVRIVRIDPLGLDAVDEEVIVLGHFTNYPRRVAFSPNGKWLAITDRDSNVYIRRFDTIGDSGARDSNPYSDDHDGPVMCLEKAGTADGEFYTAGYDGKIVRYRPPSSPDARWISEKVVDSDQVRAAVGPPTIRAIYVRTDETCMARGLWIGDESKRLCHYDFLKKARHPETTEANGVFSIASSANGELLAVGLAYGAVRVYSVTLDRGAGLKCLHEFQSPCEYIVRWLGFARNDEWLICVSWAGHVTVWSLEEEIPVFAFDANSDGGRPEEDRDKLRFRADNDIDGIKGLSLPFREYLKDLTWA